MSDERSITRSPCQARYVEVGLIPAVRLLSRLRLKNPVLEKTYILDPMNVKTVVDHDVSHEYREIIGYILGMIGLPGPNIRGTFLDERNLLLPPLIECIKKLACRFSSFRRRNGLRRRIAGYRIF